MSLSAANLDTVIKIGMGAVSAIGGGWIGGVLARRRVLRRNLRAVKLELDLLDTRCDRVRDVIEQDTLAAKVSKLALTPLPRLPEVMVMNANTLGAFDHLGTPDGDLLRELAGHTSEANDRIEHRAQFVLMRSGSPHFEAQRLALNAETTAKILEVEASSANVRSSLARLNLLQGGR